MIDGDSGGPLFRVNEEGKVIQFATTSFSTKGCAEPGGVAWYARLWSYRRAISKLIRGDADSSFRRVSEASTETKTSEGNAVWRHKPTRIGVRLDLKRVRSKESEDEELEPSPQEESYK